MIAGQTNALGLRARELSDIAPALSLHPDIPQLPKRARTAQPRRPPVPQSPALQPEPGRCSRDQQHAQGGLQCHCGRLLLQAVSAGGPAQPGSAEWSARGKMAFGGLQGHCGRGRALPAAPPAGTGTGGRDRDEALGSRPRPRERRPRLPHRLPPRFPPGPPAGAFAATGPLGAEG